MVQRGSEDAYFETAAFVVGAFRSDTRVLAQVVNQTSLHQVEELLELSWGEVEIWVVERDGVGLGWFDLQLGHDLFGPQLRPLAS